ncbi:WD-40 repeat-containing protein [Planktothrix agardhii NIES-204]|nr:WD-40 repeat-containing protein [Planktothrix agardhii NIES-204]
MNNNDAVKTILILAANPTNTSRLRLEEEIREIDEGLRRANQRHQYKLEQKLAVRSRDFYRAILDYQPQIVHFCGHGAGQDGIVLEDDTGKMVLLETKTLASMFKLFAKKSVECVILNACYSEVQAEAISQYVDYVLGMKKAVGDKAAVAFSVAFYDALAAGYEVEEAYELGCSQMMSFLEQETPVFKKKPLIPTLINIDIHVFDDVIPPNPYQGLAAFGEEDADFFFGQENFINKLVEVTQNQPLVGIIGPSGSGKSSVVFAGLIPKLRQQGNWLIEVFRPGKEPFLPLASALVRQLEPEAGETQFLRESVGLASDFQQGRITVQQVISRILERNPGKRLLLVADQLEELYTLCPVKEEQERFADELLAAIAQENVRLVFTLRADFLNYVLSYRPFRDALQAHTPQFLSSMKREELQQAIELPAQKLEVELEEQLTQRILDDVGQEPGNLPLLEFALTRLWEKQKNRTLTHAAYQEIGGVKKAIANHAEQVYQKLSEPEKQQAQRIFVQLVRPGEGTEDTRRVATRAEVGEDNWNLVSYLAGYQARLVVTGRHQKDLTPRPPSLPGNGEYESPSPRRRGVWGEVTFAEDTVEVIHEALIREWETLRQWINDNREFRTWQERLKLALREWKNNKQDVEWLLWGTLLTVAEDWLQKRADEITSEERDFIQVSIKDRDREKREIERRRRLTLMGLSGFSVIALSLAGVAGFGLWNARIKEINGLAQYSDALLNLDGSKAVKASLKAAMQMQQTPLVDADTRTQVELALLNIVSNVAAPNTLGGHAQGVYGVSFSPDGKFLATGSADRTVKLWDASTGKEIKTLSGHINSVKAVSFSPDGKLLATGSEDKTVKLWNTTTWEEIKTLTGRSSVHAVSFSPDSKLLATGSADSMVKLWDVSTGKEIKTLTRPTDGVYGVSFSPDGKLLATGSADSMVKLWDVSTGKEIKTLTGHTHLVYGVSFSPDGKFLATGSADNTVKLWDVSTGKEIKTLTGHTHSVNAVSFSPDGKFLATGSADNTVKLWDASTGKEIKTLSGHTDWVYGVSFSPDGKTLATGSYDNTVKLWDASTGKEIKTLSGHTYWVKAVSFSPDSKLLATGSYDKTVKLWDASTGEEIKPLSGHTHVVHAVSFSPDSKLLATGSSDTTVKLWNVSTGKEIKTLSGHINSVNAVSFSADGNRLATGSGDTTVKLWDVSTGKEIKTLTGHINSVHAVSFSPDGKLLATGSYDNTVKLWDASTGKEIKTLSGHTHSVHAVSFSPDGKLLATGSADNTVKLWDASTGEEIKPLSGHTHWVIAVSFSPDSKLLATGSADSRVKLWDASTGEEIKTLSGHTDWVYGVSFSPDGKKLATVSGDNKVKLWRLDFDYLVQEGCKFIDNYLKPNPDDVEAQEIEWELCSKLSKR